jgi:hypothetical protein
MTRISSTTYLAHPSKIDNKVALNLRERCLVSTNESKSKAIVNQLKKMGYEFDSEILYDPYALQSYPYEGRGEVFVEATHVRYGIKDGTVVRVFSDGEAAPIKAIDIRLYDKPNSTRYIAYRLRFDESGSGKFEMERIFFGNNRSKLFYRSKERDTLLFTQSEDGLLDVFVKSPTSASPVNMKDIWEKAKDTNVGAEKLGRWDSPKPTDCRKNTLPPTQN